MLVAYFSSTSGNTARFVTKLAAELPELDAVRLPLVRADAPVEMSAGYILITPTYGGGDGESAVPRQVKRFLSNPRNAELLRGVIACGNTNFGHTYGLAGDIISRRFGVPLLSKVEIFGTPEDVSGTARRILAINTKETTL